MLKGPGNGGEGGGRKGGKALGRSRGRERQRAHDDPFREFYLESVVAGGPRVGERGFGRFAERLCVSFCTRERLFGRPRAPWLRRDAAKGKPGATDHAAGEVERRGGGDDRESKGRALAKLEIARMRCEARRIAGQTKRNDQVPWLERAFALRRFAGQAVKLFERDLAPATFAFDLDHGVERHERHTEVRRMRRDAALAPADDRVQAVLALQRVAACAWLAPVAGARHVVEVAAAR